MSIFPLAFQRRFDEHGRVNGRRANDDFGVVATGGAMIIASLFLPWITTRGPAISHSPPAVDLTIVPWVVSTIVLVSLGALAVSFRNGRQIASYLAAGGATLLFILPTITTVLLDVLALWISPAFLPRTWRRVLIGVSPTYGTWLAMLGATLMVIGVLGNGHRFRTMVTSLLTGIKSMRRQSLGAIAALIGITMAMGARYQPWFSVDFSSIRGTPQTIDIPGYAIPFIGIAGLVLGVAAIAAAVIGVIRPARLVGSCLVVLGWLATLPATIVAALQTSHFNMTFTIPSLIRRSLAQWSTQAHRLSNGNVTLPALASHAHIGLYGSVGATDTLIGGLILSAAGILLTNPGRQGALS